MFVHFQLQIIYTPSREKSPINVGGKHFISSSSMPHVVVTTRSTWTLQNTCEKKKT